MSYFYTLAKGDITKMSEVTKLNFVFTMNFKSFEAENPQIKERYGNTK